jgi:hypothetical protein
MTEVADSQQTLIPAPAEPAREYVAGSSHWLAYRGAIRALPHAVDDLEAELGDDLYTRMRRDPRVAGDVGLLKAAILDDSITITPATTPEGDEAAATAAAEAAAFVARCLYNLQIPIEDVLDDLLDALAYGCKVAEQVYANGEGEDAGRLVLKALKVKPRKATAFVVDAYLNVLGLLAAESGRSVAAGYVAVGPDGSPPANLLPRSKFAVLTYKPKDADPRGSTILRAAYNWWWIKTQLLPELLKFGAQFGTPSLFGVTAEKATANDPTKTPEAELLTEMLQFQGGTALAVRHGTEVDVIESAQSGGESFFERAIDLCDRQISIAIYGATRATQEAENGSRADSETAKGLFDSIVSAGRWAVAAMLQRDVVAPLVAYNNPQWVKYPPVVSLGGVEAEDRTPAWNAAAALERAGYLDPSQYATLDADLGLPVRTPEEVELRRTRKAAPPVPPVAPPTQRPGQDPAEDDDEPDDEEGDDAAT